MGKRCPLLNIREIDQQHQRLFDTIDLLKNHIGSAYEFSLVFDTLTKLSEYVIVHFQYEETFLRKSNYEHLHEHIKLHEGLKNDFDHIYKRALNEEEITSELVALLDIWLIRHIGVEDVKYADTLHARS